MLKDKDNFSAEVCYVTRSYVTRHGIGDLESEALKKEINADMFDKTNITNEFQGSLRYGFPEEKEIIKRIDSDFALVEKDSHFTKTLAVTHCNEFPEKFSPNANYVSYNPYSVLKNE